MPNPSIFTPELDDLLSAPATTGQVPVRQSDGTWSGQSIGGAAIYTHTQGSAASTWTINHNLGFRPDIALFDATGQEFDADIVHTSVNQAIVYCSPAVAGSARCS